MTKTPDKLREILFEFHNGTPDRKTGLRLETMDIDQAIKSIEELFSLPEERHSFTEEESHMGITDLWLHGWNACLDEIRKRWQESKEGK